MNAYHAAEAASCRLGRKIGELFARRVLDGDPFIYRHTLQEDAEAASTVLGFARGRLRLLGPGQVSDGRWAHVRYRRRQHFVIGRQDGRVQFACGVAPVAESLVWHDSGLPHLPRCQRCERSLVPSTDAVILNSDGTATSVEYKTGDWPPELVERQIEFYKRILNGPSATAPEPKRRRRCCGIRYEHGALTQPGVSRPCHDCPDVR